MDQYTYSFLSSCGYQELHGVCWMPLTTPKALVQISHGLGEYVERYDPLAQFLTDLGYIVFGHDHLGHNKSGHPTAQNIYFGVNGTWTQVSEDLYVEQEMMRKEYPNLPLFMLGQGFGSSLVRMNLLFHPRNIQGAILIAPQQKNAIAIGWERFIASIIQYRIGPASTSPFLTNSVFRKYSRAFPHGRTTMDWVSANEENVDAYIADPQCGKSVSVQVYDEIMIGLKFIGSTAQMVRMDRNIPVLFLAGNDDPTCSKGYQVEQLAHKFRRIGMKYVDCHIYPGLRHEILHEKEAKRIYQDLSDWMDSHLI